MDKPDEPMMHNFQIAATGAGHPASAGSPRSIDRRIRAFLNGESHGEDVLGALYGAAGHEPVPDQLSRLLKP